MQLAQYFSSRQDTISFTEEQGSEFAKGVAGDFNPIHNPGTKRFCVPGDLLFCVMLHQYGVAGTTAVHFSGMVDGNSALKMPEKVEKAAHILDARDKTILSLFLDGTVYTDADFVNTLSRAYVSFSGQTFPDILVPLMRDAKVMINPDRPLVIYKDMAIELDQMPETLTGTDVTLQLIDSDITVNGRKGAVRLRFDIQLEGQRVGKGEKNMVLSGLREFDEQAMQAVVDQYSQWRGDYVGQS